VDAVEVARNIASELHDVAVKQGGDPRRSYEFALSEAKRREIDVEGTQKGAAILNGARAAYFPKDALIVHENEGSAFDRAFLVTHEIGHAVLGDDEGSTQFSIDPSRPAEPSPIGFDRVVDYGRRQRREIQMDLFAREFLLLTSRRNSARRLESSRNSCLTRCSFLLSRSRRERNLNTSSIPSRKQRLSIGAPRTFLKLARELGRRKPLRGGLRACSTMGSIRAEYSC